MALTRLPDGAFINIVPNAILIRRLAVRIRGRQGPIEWGMPSDNGLMQDWMEGPSFLRTDHYPEESKTEDTVGDDSEIVLMTQAADNSLLDDVINRCGNWKKLKRVIMRCLLFTKQCRKQATEVGHHRLMEEAEVILLRHCQGKSFPDEIRRLKKNEQVSTSSKLASLNPIIDEQNRIIRVRGRLENADIPTDQRTPIVLPANHRVTHLLIDDIHRRNGHIGLKHVVSKLRERFWLLRCISEVKKILGRCIFCRRQHRPLMTQQMAPLPADRVNTEHPPFHATGIDFFGPMNVRINRSSVKRWGVIFTCMSCRAVHLELSHSLNTDSFLAAFSRFTSRRGTPRKIYSDNETNLKSAEKNFEN